MWIARILALVLCITMHVVPASGEPLDWIVAVVNDHAILNSELEERIEVVKKLNPQIGEATGPELEKIREQLLHRMILETLTRQQVRKYGIVISEALIDAAIENFRKEKKLSESDMEVMLQKEGQTLDQFRDSIRKDLERSRLLAQVVTSKTVITDEQVDARLSPGEKTQRMVGGAYHLAVIVFPVPEDATAERTKKIKELGEEVHEELERGASFTDMAREYSMGPAAQNGGDIGYLNLDEMTPEIRSAVQDLEKGEYSPLFSVGSNYYIVKVLEIQPGHVETVGGAPDQDREKVRKEMYKQEMSRKYEEWLHRLESESFIQIHLKPESHDKKQATTSNG